MPTVGSIEYIVVDGTVAGIATFNDDVNAQVDNGYAPLGHPTTDGTAIYQIMVKGAAGSFIPEYEIAVATAGAAEAGEFEVVGDVAVHFQPGFKFTVTRSTGNDGVYTVFTAEYTNPNTVITPEEAVADGTDDGYIEMWSPSVGP